MSLTGKIFAILNIVAAAAFLVVAGMDYSQRHRWAYSVYRHQLLVDGLPIDDAEKDAEGKARVADFDEPWFAEMFQRAGANPVKTQQQEVQNLQRTVMSRVDNPDGKGTRTQKLARYVTALAENYQQRRAAQRQIGEAGTRTNDLSADLSSAYANQLDAAELTRGGHDIVKSIRDKAGQPNPGTAEIAARVPFGNRPADQTLIELQVGRDPVFLALSPEVQFAAKPGTDVFITTAATTEQKLQAILESEFQSAGKGSAGDRKAKAARLMFCLGEAMEEPTSDYFASPAYQRLAIVAGLSGAASAIDEQATSYRRMIQEIVSDNTARYYMSGAMGDYDFDRRQFIAEHNSIVDSCQNLAEATSELERILKEKDQDLARQKLLVEKRQADIEALSNRLDKDLKVKTADKLRDQARAEQEVRDRLIELRDTGRTNQDLEKEIRKLEGDQTR
jgi:hypothetical protein